MKRPLTQRQQTVVEAIRAWIRERGYPPTIRELGQRVGIKSLRGVTTHLDAIAKKGFLTRDSRARSIRLEDLVAPFEQALRVPVLGRIRAGTPGVAEEQVEDHVVIDASWLGTSGRSHAHEHFALRVRGDSMSGAGILDGDYVVVRRTPAANNGEIVVALLEDEATVKRFFKEGDHFRLQPEHPTMAPILIPADRPLTILGTVVAVFRSLS